jgi:anti-repressor protein
MESLIKIQKSTGGKDIVSARELYESLGFEISNWAKWYRKNIENNDFAIENVDYSSFVIEKNADNQTFNPKPTKDFAITIDFAKRLAMLARTERGEQIRRYFIECERCLNTQSTKALPSNYKEALKALIQAEEEKESLIVINEKQKRKILNQELDLIYQSRVLQAGSNDLISSTVIAKELGTTAILLNRFLHEIGLIYKVNDVWVPYAQFQNYGLTNTKTYVTTDDYGNEKVHIHTYWSQLGRKFIHRVYEPSSKPKPVKLSKKELEALKF